MKIQFHGANQNVTGSCHMLEVGGKRLLIDCGLYQGGREIDEENTEPFGFEPDSIDYLLLTHAHLDHCGRIPLLVKRGFAGEIITTSASRELAKLILLDSASLQESEARYKNSKVKRSGSNKTKTEIEPLYTTVDALNSFDYFGRNAKYHEPILVAKGIRVTFIDAGHILGSASILVELEENGQQRRVLFSGDLGYSGRAIIRDPDTPPEVDIVVMETTYGDRLHKLLEPTLDEFYTEISRTIKRGGNIIIPTFALERAQEILYYLREGIRDGKLPEYLPVFLDSPMAISATEIFAQHPECFDEETCEVFKAGKSPFDLPGLHFTRETAESMAINQISGGAVIMAGSGMCTGGRVRHHLKHNLWRRDCSVIFVGYAAIGTLARRIIDGAVSVKIFREDVEVRASIHTVGGFSAHADQKDLLSWHQQTGNPDTTFLVHGDKKVMQQFAKHLKHTRVEMPTLHQSYDL
jgi:metallo-beta-lactamase family protein